ncbi:hypothetical protein MVES_003292 [Malassezia vespertilionis]|uniref:Elongator complex protein 5 n=2 Tax=Malassezia vespertilionis TaxID=2020962 RepID=A0A2N1J8C6_9BASI|nr:hypothetical protein MVES_003292 [Malassezia vespertilionis]
MRYASLSLADVQRRLSDALASFAQARATVCIDALEPLLLDNEVTHVYKFLRNLLISMPAYSRLVLRTAMDCDAQTSALVAALVAPMVWSGMEIPEHGTSLAHATIICRVHPPAVIRYMHKTYGLLPPSSAPALQRAAYLDAGMPVLRDLDRDGKADPRFWTVLHSIGARGPFGSHGEPGWWHLARDPTTHMRTSLHALDNSVHSAMPPVLTLEQVLGSNSDNAEQYAQGLGFLELHASLVHGKYAEELAACAHVSTPHRLRILALDMHAQHSSSAPAGDKSLQAMVEQLPFNLTETKEQRARRDQVPLPYTFQLQEQDAGVPAPSSTSTWRGSTGQSAIFFEPESEDDEDDEDPDDDLDV